MEKLQVGRDWVFLLSEKESELSDQRGDRTK